MNEKTEYEFNGKLLLESLACGDPYLRRNFIGASDAPIIMGVSPWRTPYQLWKEKVGIEAPQTETQAMARGTEMESKARETLEKIMGRKFPSKRVFSEKYPWMMASLDGLSDEGEAVEIKCGKASHHLALNLKIADYYIPQLQHQMYVANLSSISYLSYKSENDFIILKCERDDEYIEKLIEEELLFWNCVTHAIEPHITERDYKKKDDFGWMMLCNEWRSVQKAKKQILEREEQIRKEIIESSQDQNCYGSGIKVKKVIKKGCIDYSKIFELSNVDLEQYRKESTTYWKISEEDDDA